MLENGRLARSYPERQGISSSAILGFIQAVEQQASEKKSQEMHSFMLMRHGYVVAEGWWKPYESQLPHMLFSLSKSFTSTAIGMAVDEGRLSVDDTVISFFPEDVPDLVSENLAAMRIRHLLSMSTGHRVDTTEYLFKQEDGNWVKGFFSVAVEDAPGTHFLYNTGATYMLSAILQKVTGQTLLEYLQTRLFGPLAIEGATWDSCPRGINTGGFGLSIKTEDIAKLGQLYLQKGIWNGKRILSEAWIEEATSKQISNGEQPDNDWSQGYGYQFWRCRHDIYRGDGAFGQYCIAMPEQDAVIAITSGLDDMQAVLNLVWMHLLPAMSEAPLPDDPAAREALEQKLNSLILSPPVIQISSPTAKEISGKRYALEKNGEGLRALMVECLEDQYIVTIWSEEGEQRICFGLGKWVDNKIDMTGTMSNRTVTLNHIVASATWSEPDTLMIITRMVETPFYETMFLHFEGDIVTVKSNINVSFGPKEREPVQGHIKP